jgi:hypothetical protein
VDRCQRHPHIRPAAPDEHARARRARVDSPAGLPPLTGTLTDSLLNLEARARLAVLVLAFALGLVGIVSVVAVIRLAFG